MLRRFEKFSQVLRQSIFFLALCVSNYLVIRYLPPLPFTFSSNFCPHSFIQLCIKQTGPSNAIAHYPPHSDPIFVIPQSNWHAGHLTRGGGGGGAHPDPIFVIPQSNWHAGHLTRGGGVHSNFWWACAAQAFNSRVYRTDFFPLKKLWSWEQIFRQILVCLELKFCQNRREMGLKMQNFSRKKKRKRRA